jgi:hypothetical protein
MSFTSVKELTATELAALAFVEFRHTRFTSNKLASRVCIILSESFKVRHIQLVDNLLKMAENEGLVEPSLGPKGGPGFKLSTGGAEIVGDVDLPKKHFERQAKLNDERNVEANSDPGPVFSRLLKAIPENNFQERRFISSVFRQWLDHGWLSSKQVAKMAHTGLEYGEFIEPRHYVGNSLDEWREPYIQEQLRLTAELHAGTRARAMALENERKEREKSKALIREANGKVKIILKEMERTGALNELDALISAVFPETNLTANAKAVAFAGHGSKELRVCIAAVAFGKPPALVWENAGSIRQPDAESALWRKLTEHATYQALSLRRKNSGDNP